ncbi:MAG: FAD-dependent thymidylate synthase [Mediterraneibacter sp.]
MNRIETKILNCSAIREAEKNMVFAARLTQRGHLIHNMEDLVRLYNSSFTNDTVRNMGSLPHPTIQKFSVITVAVVGASRRFLSQITRHQNEVKFTSASLQYSNYSGEAGFVKPYEILTAPPDIQKLYERSCQSDMDCCEQLCKAGISHDSAGCVTT